MSAMRVPWKRFELRVDGRLVGTYRTYDRAQVAADQAWPRVTASYDISKRVGGRLFNRGFGYRSGTTSTADLARMGVPIHASCLSDKKL